LNKLYTVTAIVLVAIIVSVSFYGVFTFTDILSPNPDSSTPTVAPNGKSITIEDDTGKTFTIPLPVNRIVSLDDGHTELLCALGAEDLIVGRDTYSTFPPSINDLPNVGAYNGISMEAIVQLEPDVVLSITPGMSPGMVNFRYASGIPVLFQDTANFTKLESTIRFLGQLVDNETGAEAIVNWVNHYVDLVDSRISGLSSSQRPTFYLGGTQRGIGESAFRYTGPDSEIGMLGMKAGGTNIVDNSTVSGIINPEFVIEKKPEYIFSLTYRAEGFPTDTTFYREVLDQINSRTGFGDVPAVTNNNVYCYDYTLVQGLRYPVGLLYFAKSLHPDLFADIEPEQVLEEMTNTYFHMDSPWIFMYP
jgi:iron complex transport system substrate-binding protein